jgi:hypothetical protein
MGSPEERVVNMFDESETDEVVRRYLEARGCADFIVETGLTGLVDRWHRIASAIASGYDGALDEYLNDMDIRDILEDALDVAALPDNHELRQRVLAADGQVRAVTVECGPIWGSEVAEAESMDRSLQWWYFIRPRDPVGMLRSEMETEGLLGDA